MWFPCCPCESNARLGGCMPLLSPSPHTPHPTPPRPTWWCSMGVQVRHMWGMTELSPLGSLNVPKGCQLDTGLSQEEALDCKVRGALQHLPAGP
jgi:hypothetical protein